MCLSLALWCTMRVPCEAREVRLAWCPGASVSWASQKVWARCARLSYHFAYAKWYRRSARMRIQRGRKPDQCCAPTHVHQSKNRSRKFLFLFHGVRALLNVSLVGCGPRVRWSLRCACPSRCCPSKAAAVVYRSARLTAGRTRAREADQNLRVAKVIKTADSTCALDL